jgi:hypothetical protein
MRSLFGDPIQSIRLATAEFGSNESDLYAEKDKGKRSKMNKSVTSIHSEMKEEFGSSIFLNRPKTPPFVKDRNFVRARTLCPRRTGTKRT